MNDYDEEYMDMRGNDFDDGFGWGNGPGPEPRLRPLMAPRSFRDQHYNNAFGDYRGGYGPGGGFGPPSFGPMPGPPPPPFMWGRGFGPRGPPTRKPNITDRVTKYLLGCGVPKENLKNLPRDFLQLIEPQFCGVCSVNLSSKNFSRMHYVSKNHFKNQRKWLAQRGDKGSFVREMPLKSRNLYCELCDVQITSQVHADSHYAGRPHRAIVEGRKNPKNPALCQKGMEGRVEQLIRREKRCLKPVEEVAEGAAVANEAKITSPELYCDICKTSVTCTEQMTMHLNGKRHLTKEKQHILKMMKAGQGEEGENEEDEEEEEGEGAEEDAANGDGAPATKDGNPEENDKKEDNFDWGNGSGTWDEPATATEA